MAAQEITLPAAIETKFYSARLDPLTGALASLKLKSSDRELLSGPANVIVAEQPKQKIGSPADHMVDRPERDRVADSNGNAPKLTVTTSPLATVVEAESSFIAGGKLRRKMVFHNGQPRIDFETELNDLPDRTVVVAEFPLAGPVREVRRGIPYGFSQGIAKGIAPAVRWSHYQMADAGVALLDQGLSGRELNGDTPVIYLYNAAEKYRGYANSWLSGAGRHVLRYALAMHAGDFTNARIARMAWDYNTPEDLPALTDSGLPAKQRQCHRRGAAARGRRDRIAPGRMPRRRRPGQRDLESPPPRCGVDGHARWPPPALAGWSGLHLPRAPAADRDDALQDRRCRAEVKPLTEWDELVPEKKREALRRYLPDVKGHPPAGGQ